MTMCVVITPDIVLLFISVRHYHLSFKLTHAYDGLELLHLKLALQSDVSPRFGHSLKKTGQLTHS